MAINRIEIKDFLVFKGDFAADFCPGVNVLIGGNATGKTTLLKVLYWACEVADTSISTSNSRTINLIPHFFLKDFFGGQNDSVLSDDVDENFSKIRISEFSEGENVPALNASIDKSLIISHYNNKFPIEINELYLWFNRKKAAVFIPTTEMLSHSRGFLALNKERAIPFDKTEIDIISKAELGPTREITPNAAIVLERLADVIGGTVSHDGKDFFVEKTGQNIKIPFSFEASGYRKLGLLWKLLRNGLLESGSILFWDEPENSLNPEHVPVLVDILRILARNGVQIFIATHNYNLARYFDVRKDKSVPVMFHNLSKPNDDQIVCKSSPEYLKLPDNLLEETSEKLFNTVIADALGVQNDE